MVQTVFLDNPVLQIFILSRILLQVRICRPDRAHHMTGHLVKYCLEPAAVFVSVLNALLSRRHR